MFDKNTTFGRISNLLLTLVVCTIMVTIPIFYVESYTIYQFSMIAVYAIILMGLNILTGLSGQLSLGHGAFYALGAYVAAIFLPNLGAHFYLVFPIAAVIGYILGLFLGIVAIRFKGHYLAIVTISLAVATPSLIKYLEVLTGGTAGVNITRPVLPSWLSISSDQYTYLIALLLALLFFYMTRNILKSHKGRGLVAIRDNDIVAATMGVNVLRFKVTAFAISLLYAGVAGSLAALIIQFISPEVFSLEVSIYFLVALLIGGAASKWGPIYGAFYILYLPNISESVAQGAPILLSGLILILLIIFTPGGTNEIVMRTYYKIRKNIWF